MNYIKFVTVLLVCLINAGLLQAQEHHHEHAENEAGISGGAVYSLEHKEWSSGVHVHYFRMLEPHSKWSLGGEFETVFGDDVHFTIGAGVKYQIIDDWSIGLLPGITFSKHDSSKYEPSFSLHFETVYDLFHWEKFHLGPAIDYSWSKEDSHISIGVHAAYCF